MELYLSRIILNPLSKAVMNDLSSPRELHKTISRCFPAIDGQTSRPQHEKKRREVLTTCFIASITKANVRALCSVERKARLGQLSPGYAEDQDAKPVHGLYANIKNGDPLRFRLAANPTRRAGKSDIGNAKFHDQKKRRRIDIRTE